ncbi:hypothetical protein LXL04_014007 [Taraxacum kok-saghyz]
MAVFPEAQAPLSFPVNFEAPSIVNLGSTEGWSNIAWARVYKLMILGPPGDMGLERSCRLSPDRVRHQTVLPNAQTKDRVRHLRQNLSLRLFKADRVRRKITDSGPSPTSNTHYQTHRLWTESESVVKMSAVCGPPLQSSTEEEVVQTSAVCSKKTIESSCLAKTKITRNNKLTT